MMNGDSTGAMRGLYARCPSFCARQLGDERMWPLGMPQRYIAPRSGCSELARNAAPLAWGA
ncbi:hypothetical protein LNP74_05190 [Klebsiella pneumoniae subsp. pneumoniae]|nr:hypothetical protein [Klebsiella pneumoniae subsp. pneumoniae]